MANTIAAIVEPPGDSTVSATTSTGTSRMRIRVSAFGRLSGNTRSSGYPAPARQVLDPGRAPERAERGHGRGEQRPREDAAPAPLRHEQAEQDPAEAVRPAERSLGGLAEAADRRDDQRAEDADLHERVDPNGLEVRHGREVRVPRAAGRADCLRLG